MVTMVSANTAPARLTKDSSASDSRPTEPVSHQARVLSTMVSSATTTEMRIRLCGAIQSDALAVDGVDSAMLRCDRWGCCGLDHCLRGPHARIRAMNGWQRSAGWVLAWAVAAGCGAAWLAHGRLQSLREVFDTDARIAHRLLSQRMVQHDAILGTLALLQPRQPATDQASWKQLPRLYPQRSEEHTSELQSPCNLVCRLLLEKKKKKIV